MGRIDIARGERPSHRPGFRLRRPAGTATSPSASFARRLPRAAAGLLLVVAGMCAVPTVARAQTMVADDWTLIPSGLGAGDSFRLIFATSTTRNATSDDIAVYNTFVQTRAAAGHSAIQTHSSGFRVVGCTADVDARDNTSTTYTTSDKGVPVYWLNGNKAADDYEDFYDGSWDDETNPTNESGNARNLDGINAPYTGCNHNGTEAFFGSLSTALGATNVRVGDPNSTGAGPLNGDSSVLRTDSRPFYGLSPVFEVAQAQTLTTFVSNGTSSTSGANFLLQQSFTTGTHTGGYVLSEIDIPLGSGSGTNFSVKVREDDSGDAGELVATLANPPTLTENSVNTFTAPAGTTLKAGTTYWISLGEGVTLRETYRDKEGDDETGEAGWSIGNGSRIRSNMNSDWTASTKSLVFSIKGTLGSAATGQPNISGTPQVGMELMAGQGDMDDADNLPVTPFPDGYTFQWVSVDDMDAETDIMGATALTYEPVAADVGNRLKVEVTFTDGVGTEETLASDLVGPVVAAAGPCPADNDWCATMTVGMYALSSVLNLFGFNRQGRQLYGLLDNTTIPYDSSFEVVSIYIDPNDFVRVHLDAYVPLGTVFNLGGTEFTVDADSRSSTQGWHFWDRPADFTWLDGQEVTVSANLPPLLERAALDGTSLTLTYAEDLDTNSVPAADAFEVDVDGADGPTVSSVAVSGNTVTLTLATEVTGTDVDVTLDYEVPSSNPLQDLSGLDAPALDGFEVNISAASGQPNITGTPQVGMELTAGQGDIADTDGLPGNFPNDYRFQWVRVDDMDTETDIGSDSHTYTPVAADVGNSIRVEVSFTDGSNNPEGPLASDATATVVRAPEDCATDRPHNDWCTTLTAGVRSDSDGRRSGYFGGLGRLDDSVINYGPSFEVLRIEIDESLIGDDTVSVDLDALVPSGSVFNLGGTEFTDSGVGFDAVTFAIYIWDRPSGFTWLDGQEVTVSANLAPLLERAAVDGTTLTLTYAEDLDTNSVPAVDAFEVDVDGSDGPDVSSVTVSGNKVTLTLATAITVLSDTDVKLDYTAPASNPLQDLSGLDAPSFTDRTVDTVDETAPALESAEVFTNGGGILLTFDEDLDVGPDKPLPPTSDFTVTVGGDEITVELVDRSADDEVFLQLGFTVKQGQTVTVSYTKSASGAIRDAAGNETAPFTDHPVNNNSTVPGAELDPDSLEVNEGATESYRVRLGQGLATQPTGPVTVTLSVSDASVTLSPQSLVFTPSTPNDWRIWQRVTVTAVDDSNAVDEEVTVTHTASGGGYDGATLPDLTVTVVDNDGAVEADRAALTFAESGSGTYALRLTRRPTSDVTVKVTGFVVDEVNVAPPTLTFTPDDWDAWQAVAVISFHDADKNDEVVTLRHTATGGGYSVEADDGARAAPVRVTVEDDEATAPGAPGLTARGANESAVLRWDPPGDNGGAPVTGYRYRRVGGTAVAVPGGADARTVTVPGLDNGTEYAFELQALNRIGEGTWSTARTAIPIPQTLTVEAVSDEVTEGEPVRYRIVMSECADWVSVNLVYAHEGEFMRFAPSSSGQGIRCVGGEKAWEIERGTVDDDDIEAHGSFTVTLRPGDGYGLGTPSSATIRILDNDGGTAPGAPPRPAVSVVSPRILEATWRAAPDNGAALTGYEMEYREGTTGPWTRWPEAIAPDTRSVRIGALSPDTAHQVRVRANNVRGDGPWSTPGEARTAPDPGVRVSIARPDNSSRIGTEGDTLAFTVHARPAPTSALRVDVRVTETLETILGRTPTSVTVPAGQDSVSFEVRTEDDDEDESHYSRVTAELRPSVRYVLEGTRAVTYTVIDNDADTERGRPLRPRVEAIEDPNTRPHVREVAEDPVVTLRLTWGGPRRTFRWRRCAAGWWSGRTWRVARSRFRRMSRGPAAGTSRWKAGSSCTGPATRRTCGWRRSWWATGSGSGRRRCAGMSGTSCRNPTRGRGRR